MRVIAYFLSVFISQIVIHLLRYFDFYSSFIFVNQLFLAETEELFDCPPASSITAYHYSLLKIKAQNVLGTSKLNFLVTESIDDSYEAEDDESKEVSTICFRLSFSTLQIS